MSSESKKLQSRIEELEGELQAKEAQLAQMRLRLGHANNRLEQVIDQINSELKIAGKIQKLLSPVEIPHISGFEFSTKFIPGSKSGGDYFDIFEHADKMKFGIVLSACSGYTMSALFLSVLIKLSSKIEAQKGMPPHEVLLSLAQEILPHVKPKDSASLWYGVVDRRRFELSYCSIGSIAALHAPAGKDHLTQLSSQGPALTSEFSGKIQSVTSALGPLDRLVLCSPGITDRVSPKGESFGEVRLREAIHAAPRKGVHEVRNEIFFQNDQFSGNREPERDQTVLVLEVKDKVIKLAKQ